MSENITRLLKTKLHYNIVNISTSAKILSRTYWTNKISKNYESLSVELIIPFCLRVKRGWSTATSSSDSASEYDISGESWQPRLQKDLIFPVAASNRPRYGGEGFKGREIYSGWYCTPTK